MSVQLLEDGHLLYIELSGELTVAQVSAIHADIAAIVNDETSVLIDVSRVDRVDTSVAQLFFALSKHVKTFRIEAQSPAWILAWERLGLHQPVSREYEAVGR